MRRDRFPAAAVAVCLVACAPAAPVKPATSPGPPPTAAPAPVAAQAPTVEPPSPEPPPPDSCLAVLRAREKGGAELGATELVICKPDEDDAVRDFVKRLQTGSGDPDMVMPVIGYGCRLERICGNIAGVDCKSAVDGPYDYFELMTWKRVAECGGRCMGGRCTNCPPRQFHCPTY